ncbi:MAG: esterase family protein [Verrucomicrobiales bacterium]|jgi:S-formylglutathione hydrolase FrmB|nr:esterase family protein [Verrucomicrobiales bacterium]
MALAYVNLFSESLGLSTAINVLLPQPTSAAQIGLQGAAARASYPVLYLLHGWSDDETSWLRRTSIERYAAELGLAVVMPRVDLSFYQDTVSGMNYWTYLSEELPALCRAWFPIAADRAHTFAAGLSMGGYGALRLGLARPEQFAAVASLSGVTDIRWATERKSAENAEQGRKIAAIFGARPTVSGTDADLFHLAQQLTVSGRPAPRLYQGCGTEDFLYRENTAFRDHVRALGLDLTYEEGPGAHEWGYWDTMIRRVLQWLPVPR